MGAFSFFSKSLQPLRCHLVSDSATKSSLQALFENALGKTRQLLRVFSKRKSDLSSDTYRRQHRLPVEYFPKASEPTLPLKSRFIYKPGFIQAATSKWVSNSLAGALSKESRKNILKGGGGPMLCFVGFVLAKKPSLLTDEEELEKVSYEIRESFSAVPPQPSETSIFHFFGSEKPVSLSDLKIGDLIAKGCNAAVYSACLDEKVGDVCDPQCSVKKDENTVFAVENDNALPPTKLIISHSEGEQNFKNGVIERPACNKNAISSSEKFDPYNLAVKVMFNYDAESNAYAIWRAMYKETLPAIAEFSFSDVAFQKMRKKKLRPHPNIVEMYFAFADQIPLLPGAFKNYPQALPVRLLDEGCGRNMTLFLVMKRYHCSLQEYLKMHDISAHTSLLLFTQLLEALVHLLQNGIAHRDLKTDNILLDLSCGAASPRLSITDFGCSLEGLHLPYPSYDVEKGGNVALMAPEVISVEPGPLSVIDYTRSDLWTAGTLAYEIFGAKNPFYSANSSLKNKLYDENNLPPLPSKTPAAVQKLVKDILLINPNKRPRQNFAATVCQVLLNAPLDVLSTGSDTKTSQKALEWMLSMSAETYLEASLQNSKISSVEFELRRTFCTRIQFLDIVEALNYIESAENVT